VALTAGMTLGQEFDETASAVDEEGVETLLQGPIHEAFAKPVESGVEPGPVVLGLDPRLLGLGAGT
jgi:hypothetical protein